MKINPKKNLTFYDYVFSYIKNIKLKIRFFFKYKEQYKNYFQVVYHIIKDDYPFTGVSKNGEKIIFDFYGDVYNNLMNFDYNKKEDYVTLNLDWHDKPIILYGIQNSGDIDGVFINQDYHFLPVKDSIVVDIGSNIGDSCIYFAINGAKKIIALEPDLENFNFAQKNFEKII